MAVRRSPRPSATQAAGLKDVAKRAGVSTATVSRVINGTAVVSEDMRRRVEQACATLGYIPNGAARALSTRRTRTIGAVVPTIENDGFARTVFSLQRSLQQAGRTLLLANSDYDPAIELEAVMRLLSQGIDGLMLIGGEHDKLLRKHLERKHVPVIEAWTLGDPAASVGFDNARAASVLTEHLLDLGHRRIAVVAGRLANNDRATARVLGMRDSLSRRGLELHAEWTTAQPYRVGEGRRAARDLLSVGERPTAILCGNDQLAFGVMAEARAMGISVPHDLSVTGFGDSDYAEFLDPPLTTMRVPAEEIGRRAAAWLVSRINGEPSDEAGTVAVELVVRSTTAPPR